MVHDPNLPIDATYVVFRDARGGPVQRLWRRVRARLDRLIEGRWTDGFFTERMAEVPEFVRRVSRIAPTTPVLDVGCAGSFMPAHYIAMGYEVHGLDLRDPGLDIDGFRFVRGDAARVELAQKYDAITLLSTLEHCGFEHYGGNVASGDADVIANLRRFLSPRGRFICSVPCGRPAELGWWRVYDEERLLRVFGVMERARWFVARSNAWHPCERPVAVACETTCWPPGALVVFESPALPDQLGPGEEPDAPRD